VIPAADYNGQRVQNRKLSLSDDGADARSTPRSASKKSGSRPR
jgi:hypothetical protein